ncbi:hypothetical protein [Marinicellulosiphila megalodicopiae]|uniref:hypothetical protein n=1 Tax=Marinicellulosiphila megalodicopiae TaxID=2724896 RepID=UPI003BB0E2F0
MNIQTLITEKQSLNDSIFKREQDKTFETLLNADVEHETLEEKNLLENSDVYNLVANEKLDVLQFKSLHQSNIQPVSNITMNISGDRIYSKQIVNIDVKSTPVQSMQTKNVESNINKMDASSRSAVPVAEINQDVLRSFLFVKKENKLFLTKKKYELIQKDGNSIFNIFKEFGIKLSKLVVSGNQVQEK